MSNFHHVLKIKTKYVRHVVLLDELGKIQSLLVCVTISRTKPFLTINFKNKVQYIINYNIKK